MSYRLATLRVMAVRTHIQRQLGREGSVLESWLWPYYANYAVIIVPFMLFLVTLFSLANYKDYVLPRLVTGGETLSLLGLAAAAMGITRQRWQSAYREAGRTTQDQQGSQDDPPSATSDGSR